MGVDYTANYGIGFRVNEPDEEILEDYDGSFDEYLEDVLPRDKYNYFECGNSYSGYTEGFYVILKNDKIDFNLSERGLELKEFLLMHDLVNDDAELSVVGGLKVW